jgi:hypothetical protein
MELSSVPKERLGSAVLCLRKGPSMPISGAAMSAEMSDEVSSPAVSQQALESAPDAHIRGEVFR